MRIEKALEHLSNEKDFIFQAVFNQDDPTATVLTPGEISTLVRNKINN